MKIWLDAQLSPATARWLAEALGCDVTPVRDLGLRDASDREIYLAARRSAAIVITKDADFASLHDRLGPPPQVIWLRCGNTSNIVLREILTPHLPAILHLLSQGESLIEILETS